MTRRFPVRTNRRTSRFRHACRLVWPENCPLSGPDRHRHGRVGGRLAIVLAAVLLAACGRGIGTEYEFEQDNHLALDGSATVYVNASLPALVALAGLDVPVDPLARLDRTRIRRQFESPVARVQNVRGWRRHGRRFVSVRLDVPDIRALAEAPPFAGSTYSLRREGESYVYSQTLGPTAGRQLSDVGWSGEELVGIRLHLPSRIEYHNAGSDNLRRGNILVWEQAFAERHEGVPLTMDVRVASQSILHSTLWLFGLSAALALTVLGGVVWWMVRRRDED